MSFERKGFISWDEYFMALTSLSLLKREEMGKGACIIDDMHRILSVGASEVPYSILQNEEADFSSFVINPLASALYTFRGRREELCGGTVYLSSFPTPEESRHIAQARLRKVIYLTKDISSDLEYVSRKILDCAHTELTSYYDMPYSLKEYMEFLKDLKEMLRKHIGKVKEGPFLLDEYFMSVAILSSLRSKDPSTKVGAVLVSKENSILSISYNGAPYGMDDALLPWDSPGEANHDFIHTKDPYIVHAEMNAFDHYKGHLSDLKHAKMYLLYSPCAECSKRIAMSGIDRVIYLREYKKNGVSKISYRWLNRGQVVTSLYDDLHDYTKEECVCLQEDTAKVIQKYLKK